MSKLVHKIEEVLHIGHKEEDKHKEGKHKAEECGEHKAEESGKHEAEHGGHGKELKDIMHKIAKKMGGGHGKKHRTKVHHEEGEECQEGEEGEEEQGAESHSEGESEEEEEGGQEEGGGGFEFEF